MENPVEESCAIKLNGLKAVLLGIGALCLFGVFLTILMSDLNMIPAWPSSPHARLGRDFGVLVLAAPFGLAGVRLLLCCIVGRPAITAKSGKLQDNILGKSYDFKDIDIVEPSKGTAILIRIKPDKKAYTLALWCSDTKWAIAERLNAVVQASRSEPSA
jgi:hypothetical protein